MRTQVIIEDHVLPQLLTSAIEAYEVSHRAHERGRVNNKLETFGLLWGYALPPRDMVSSRLVAVLATVETSALRHAEWVKPSTESLIMKRDFFREYWPQLELIGTFHSHPYESLADMNAARGWQASEDDKSYWPFFHESTCPDMDELAHLVIAVTALARTGTAEPTRLVGGESSSSYAITAQKRKLWIKAYTTARHDKIEDDDDSDFDLEEEITEISIYHVRENQDVLLEIPSLEARFRHQELRR